MYLLSNRPSIIRNTLSNEQLSSTYIVLSRVTGSCCIPTNNIFMRNNYVQGHCYCRVRVSEDSANEQLFLQYVSS